AAPEHVQALQRAMERMDVRGEVVAVRRPEQLASVSCIVIPGGESTTISKLLQRLGLYDPVVRMGREGVPILGTCAGCVLLASEGDDEVERTGTRLLNLMDMKVDRNAFGRQKDSFEAPLRIEGMDEEFPGIFIRGPVIERTWGCCKALCAHEGRIVMARQDNLLATSFHPELTGDTRLHELLLGML
ncbi:MAG TPA: pyridoxal 5'-phosphate synthase glutaminase subunit PdxT, partial [Methanomassiliicoccaceae archaeon]|nr:pyridoxal 5'-phosphate synthase glutaminase subunit PdxT [Methanomassiliicoccaceae archaeon]